MKKPGFKSVMPSMLGLLLAFNLAPLSMAGPDDAAKVPRGVHMQSPRLDPELVRKTREETDKVIQRGDSHRGGRRGRGGKTTERKEFES